MSVPYFARITAGKSGRKLKIIVKTLQQEAQQENYTPTQTAIAWVLRQPAIVAAIVGARTPKQIEEHLQGLRSFPYKKIKYINYICR